VLPSFFDGGASSIALDESEQMIEFIRTDAKRVCESDLGGSKKPRIAAVR
jgi:hypothetical protein